MKKFLLSILILAYAISSQGMTVSLHYCCGKLVDFSLAPGGASCGKKEAVKAKGCCDNQEISTHTDDQKAEYISLATSTDGYWIAPTAMVLSHPAPAIRRQTIPSSFLPPPLLTSRLHILYGVFRI